MFNLPGEDSAVVFIEIQLLCDENRKRGSVDVLQNCSDFARRILVLYLLNLYTLMIALYWKIVEKVGNFIPIICT